MQLWYALAKTLSEQAAWALAMDRMLNMVSVNAGLVVGPAVAQQNPCSTMSYLKGIKYANKLRTPSETIPCLQLCFISI